MAKSLRRGHPAPLKHCIIIIITAPQVIFADEFNEFNDFIRENIESITKSPLKEVSATNRSPIQLSAMANSDPV